MSQENFIERLANHIQSHYDLTKQELTVVFPNKRAAFYLRSRFKQNYNQAIWLPQMLSIEEAVTLWSGITLVDNLNLLFELIDIDAQLHVEQNSDLSVFGSQAAQMAKDFDEIDQYDIDAKHLFHYVVENKKLEIWNFDEAKSKEKELKYLQFFNSLYDYYLRLRDRLSAKGQGYYGMITRHLAHLSDEAFAERLGERKVIFAGFNALTTTEERLIDRMVSNGQAEVLFDYDSYYTDDPNNEAGLFARRYRDTHPDWMKNGLTDQLGQEEKNIHIISASGNTLQAKALQYNLQKCGSNDTAVILADENLLIPVINAIPETENIKDFKVSMGYPISKTPVNLFIKSYFNLQRKRRTQQAARGWYLWSLFRLMDQELVKIVFTPMEMTAFEQWKTNQVNHGKYFLEEDDLETLSIAPDVQAFIRLMLYHERGSGLTSHQTTLLSLQQLLLFVSNKIQSKPEEKGLQFLLNQVSEVGKIINRIEQIVARHTDYLQDENSIEILYKLLSSNTSIKLNSSSTEGLQIMGLLETRNINFEKLHVLSVNEGTLPSDKSQGSFIPHYVKKECGLPGYIEKQAVFAYHFYRLLQNGKDIYLYYNNLAATFGGEASRFILQIRMELAQKPNIHLDEKSFGCEAHATAATPPLSAQKAETMETLRKQIAVKGLSPSALSVYIACPLKYYLKNIVHIEDSSLEEAVGANVVGTLIHDTLDFLLSPYLPKDGKMPIVDKALFDKEILPRWEAMLNQSIAKNMPSGFPDVGFNYLNKITIRQQLKGYMEYTSKQLENNQMIVLKTEDDLSARLTTPVGDCLIKGRTDRIDRWGDLIRVIDYKTGKVDNTDLKVPVRHPEDDDLSFLKSIPEKALQLLLYKYMYLKENPQVLSCQVEGKIHALRYNNIEFGLSQTKPTKNEEAVPFLDDATFIEDMEAMLNAIVVELLDAETPFTQTEDKKKCRNCDFRGICKR